MEIYFVNRNRLNVYLTDRELTERHIDIHKLFTDGKTFEKELKAMLESVETQAKFPIKNTPLEVELFPIAEGDLLISLCRNNEYRLQGVFSDVENVIACCKALHGNFEGESSLFKYREKYYFCLWATDLRAECVLLEFADEVYDEFSVSEAVLLEYGQEICTYNCIELFTKQFEN